MNLHSILEKAKLPYIKAMKWGSLTVVITFIKQIVLIPFFLTKIGVDGYSLWLIFNSVIFLVRAVNLGQLNYSSNLINVNYYKGENVNSIINSAKGANVIMFTFQILLILLLSIPEVQLHYTGFELEFILKNDAFKVLFLLGLTRLIYQVFSLFYLRLFEPLGKIDQRLKYDVLGEIIEVGGTIIALFLFQKLLSIVYVISFLKLGYVIFCVFHIRNKLKIFSTSFSFNVVDSLMAIARSTKLALSFALEKVHENGLAVIITYLYTPTLVALVNTTRTMSNTAMRGVHIISEPLMPNLQKSFAKNKLSDVIQPFISYWIITSMSIIVMTSIIFPFSESVYKLWTVNTLEFNQNLMLWMFNTVFVLSYATILTQFLRKVNMSDLLLEYNILKLLVTMFFLYLFGIKNNIEGVGVALFLGEYLGSIWVIFRIKPLFIEKEFRVIVKYFLLGGVFLLNGLIFIHIQSLLLYILVNIICICIYIVNGYSFLKKKKIFHKI